MKHFIVIDMQNDFCTGTLAKADAVAIIPKIKEKLSEAERNGYNIIFTLDTHFDDYLDTNEGKHLPVTHCLEGTDGWRIVSEFNGDANYATLQNKNNLVVKHHFGYDKWSELIKPGDEVTMVGTCTDICVISNAIAIKMIDGVEVDIIADCCAGSTKEKHKAALEVMRSCQCNVV